MRKKLFIGSIVLLCCIACNADNRRNLKQPDSVEEDKLGGDRQSDSIIENEQSSDGQTDLTFDIDAYLQNTSENCISISDAIKQYDSDIQKVKENSKISFDDCDFCPLPDFKEVSVIAFQEKGVTVEEGIKIINDWIDEIGLTGIVDVEKELRDASGQLPRDITKVYPYDYADVAGNKAQLSSGKGFFLNTNQCYIQLGADGIYSMSNGKITAYLGEDGFAAMDALGIYQEDIVEGGFYEDMALKTYDVADGSMSVKEGADMAIQYFLKGTPYPCAPETGVTFPWVNVFSLGDKYGYAYGVGRTIYSIPVAYNTVGSRRYFEDSYNIMEDSKTAYVIDHTGVCAFTGHSEAEPYERIGGVQKEMLGLKDAVDVLDTTLAKGLELDIERVELSYCPIQFEVDETIGLVTWLFKGVNRINQQRMRIYLDVITGEIYYFTEGEG